MTYTTIKQAIEYVVENSFIEGLTESVEKWFTGQGVKVKRSNVQDEVNAEVEAIYEQEARDSSAKNIERMEEMD